MAKNAKFWLGVGLFALNLGLGIANGINAGIDAKKYDAIVENYENQDLIPAEAVKEMNDYRDSVNNSMINIGFNAAGILASTVLAYMNKEDEYVL